MTWNTGNCEPGDGYAIVITDAYPEPVWISDADVRADDADALSDAVR